MCCVIERYGFGILNDNEELLMTVRRSLNDEVLPRHLQFLENFAKASTTGWIANTEGPSIADFILGPRLRWLVSGVQAGISTDLLSHYPHLQGVVDRLYALPQVVQYYAQREAAAAK
jgi:glutathione S-transferase